MYSFLILLLEVSVQLLLSLFFSFESFSQEHKLIVFSLESEWQQVSSSHQDSYQYSDRFQQCYTLDGLHSSFYVQVLLFLNQAFSDCTKRTNYNWHHLHIYIP